MKLLTLGLLVFIFSQQSCATHSSTSMNEQVQTGAENINAYLPQLKDKRVGIFCNQTATFPNKIHLVDSLLSLGVDIALIFAPEHGFRGDQDAGSVVNNSIDKKTGIHIISLYGDKKAPSKKDLERIDIFVFDIQDVGVRFYTFISSLEYAMQSCIKYRKPFILLDRPNPNGHYIDGPILKHGFKSFIGMQPVPIVYGMTIGEYGLMLKGEKWIEVPDEALESFDFQVIPCTNYTHNTIYQLPIAPSPNLQSHQSVLLYPSLGLFEGTPLSVGRGTPFPYEVFGHPSLPSAKYPFTFVPKPNKGNKNPIYKNQKVHGKNPKEKPPKNQLVISYLLNAFSNYPNQATFFTNANKSTIPFFDKLVGSNQLRKQIKTGLNEQQIRASWVEDINNFKQIRAQYLLYP